MSSSETENGDFGEAFERKMSLDVAVSSQYPLRGLRSVKLESCSPGEVRGSSGKV